MRWHFYCEAHKVAFTVGEDGIDKPIVCSANTPDSHCHVKSADEAKR